MKGYLLKINFIKKSIFTFFITLFSVFGSTAQNSQPGNITTALVASDNTKNVVWNRTPVCDINLINVVPNPAINQTKLVFNSSLANINYEIRVINNSGIQLHIIDGSTLKGINTVDLQVGNYPPGIYFIQLLLPGGLETLKFLK
mgnify:CR=1 FL=1